MKKYIAILMTAILMTGCAADVETSTPATESTENTTVITTTTVEVEENTPIDTEDNNSDTEAEDNNSTPATTETEDTSSTTTTEAETEDNTSTPVDTTVTTTVTEESNPVDTEDTTPTDNEGTVTEEKPVVTTTTAATTKPVTEGKPETKPTVTTTTTTKVEEKEEPVEVVDGVPAWAVGKTYAEGFKGDNINTPKKNDLFNYNVKPINNTTTLKDDNGTPVNTSLDYVNDTFAFTEHDFYDDDANVGSYFSNIVTVGTDIPAGWYYVTRMTALNDDEYFYQTDKNGKACDKLVFTNNSGTTVWSEDYCDFYIYAKEGDTIKASSVYLMPASGLSYHPIYKCEGRGEVDYYAHSYYVSEEFGIKPGTYTVVKKTKGTSHEGAEIDIGTVAIWDGTKKGFADNVDHSFTHPDGDVYSGYIVKDNAITITVTEGQLVELIACDIVF